MAQAGTRQVAKLKLVPYLATAMRSTGYTVPEIAEVLGLAVPTVEHILDSRRARKDRMAKLAAGVKKEAVREPGLAEISPSVARLFVDDVLSGTFGPDVASQVTSFLGLVEDRERRVSALAGEPLLIETESLAQSYAGSFHRDVFEKVLMLDSGSLVALLQPLGGVSDVRNFAKRLRDSAEVIALKAGRAYVYPMFQFDAEKHRLWPPVAQVNRILIADKDPWGAMAWWVSENPRWGRRRPIDHPDAEQLVGLAEALTDDGF